MLVNFFVKDTHLNIKLR